MLREKSLRKILVSSAALFSLMLIYLIPKEDDKILKNIKQNLEYVSSNVITNEIYLLNNSFPKHIASSKPANLPMYGIPHFVSSGILDFKLSSAIISNVSIGVFIFIL